MMIVSIPEARSLIEQGGVIAYPTEAVYGLGCSPFKAYAVQKLLSLKSRAASKGLILLINCYEQLWPLIQLTPDDPLLEHVRAAWPGHTTFLFPKSDKIPSVVSGDHDTIAIRMTAHPIASALAKQGPICSTSANLSGCPPMTDLTELQECFDNRVDGIVSGELGNASQPSTIIHLMTQDRIR